MVQKYKAPVRVYKYPFELVMAAYERRFPTCHLIPVFIGSDIIRKDCSEDGSTLVIERRCIIKVDAPYLLRKITGVDHVLFIQKNTLDRRKRLLKIEAWNESFSSHINIKELCYYRASPENWTHFEQSASLEVKQFWGFDHVVERLAVKHYSQNVNKGAEIIEYHINELAKEDITYIEPYDASTVTTMAHQPSIDSTASAGGAGEHLANGEKDGDDGDGDNGACNNPKHAHLKPRNSLTTTTTTTTTKTTDKNKNVVINNSAAANGNEEHSRERPAEQSSPLDGSVENSVDESVESNHSNNIKNGHLKQKNMA